MKFSRDTIHAFMARTKPLNEILFVFILFTIGCSQFSASNQNGEQTNSKINFNSNSNTNIYRYGKISPQSYNGLVIIKFKEGSNVRHKDGGFKSDLPIDLTHANQLTGGLSVKRLFQFKTVEAYEEETAKLRDGISNTKICREISKIYM